VYALLLEYFTLYNEIGDWFFTSQDIEDVISGVLSSEYIVLHPYQAYINRFLDKEESEETVKTKNEKTTDKPQSIYDLLALQPYENSSKQDWYSAIMRHYRVSRRTVYNWLHQFGCEDDIRTYQYNSPHNKNKTKKELIEELEIAYKKIEELLKMIEKLHKN
jgi:Fe2+ or Zn2+ uptake regulation protein